jgi:DNA-directed RNA polymerase subunit RPC12/RpoP
MPIARYICFHCQRRFVLKATRTAHEAVCPKRPRKSSQGK